LALSFGGTDETRLGLVRHRHRAGDGCHEAVLAASGLASSQPVSVRAAVARMIARVAWFAVGFNLGGALWLALAAI
jgi:hypothetical protein